MLCKPCLDHGVRLDCTGQGGKCAEVLTLGDSESTKLQRELDLLHLPAVQPASHEGLQCLLHKVVQMLCVDLDIQVRRNACIVVKLVGQEAGHKDKDGLTTGCGEGSTGHVTDGCLQFGGLGHALGDRGRVEGEWTKLMTELTMH